jgi:hypothetical protein
VHKWGVCDGASGRVRPQHQVKWRSQSKVVVNSQYAMLGSIIRKGSVCLGKLTGFSLLFEFRSHR